MADITGSLFSGHKWVNSMHVVVGPILSLIAYLAYELCFNNSFEEQIKLEAKLQGECCHTHDFKEGVLAFLENRSAGFEGR